MLKIVKCFDLKEISPLVKAKLPESDVVFNSKHFSSQEILENPHKHLEALINEVDSKHVVNCALEGPNGSISGALIVERSSWDTEIFGVGVGKLKFAVFNPDVDLESRASLFQAIKEQAFTKGLDVIL